MNMKMTLREAEERFGNLARLGTMVFPSKLSFAISYNLEKLQKEAERIAKERKNLCERYADKDENGNPVMESYLENGVEKKKYKIAGRNQRIFDEEHDSLMDTEVEIEIRTVDSAVIEECEEKERYTNPTVGTIFALAFMTTE